MSAFLLPNAGGEQEPDRVRHSWLVYTYKRAVCVCLSVCLLFIGHTTFVHFAALPPSPRAGAIAGGPARRAQASMHSESTRAHGVQLLNEKIAALMPFKNN